MTVRIPFDELVALLAEIFRRHGCSEHVAALLAANMATAQRDGALSHGVFRLQGYLGSLDSGWVDGRAVPLVEDVAPGFLRVDAKNGFAQPALAAARAALLDRAELNGIALLSIRDSHHFGALWPDVEPFAREGFVALAMVNSMASVVPHGGHSKVFGTNPLAFAAPREGDPLVFDLAAAALSNGDVQIAAREGRQLEPGMGIDRHGRPTTDPNAVLDGGALNAFGGHKGAALALLMEVMSAGLSGGYFSFEVDWSAYPGAATPKSGETLILIDPRRGAIRDFTARIEALVAAIRGAGGDRLPGDRRYANRRAADRLGIALEEQELSELRALARS
jgi:delta1-piperideine-2-carboxylate reductase